jgi:hypothetical protein
MNKITSLRSRKKLLILIGLGVISVVGIYTLLCLNQWNQIRSNTEASKQMLQSRDEKLFSAATSAKERSSLIDELANMSLIETCSVGWWADWQAKVIPSTDKTKKTCETTQKTQANVQKAASLTRAFLQDQKTIQSVLLKLSLGKTAITEGDFAKHAKEAASVSKSLETLSVSAVSHSTLEKAQKAAKTLSDAWGSVQKADKSEDRDRYEQSIDKLDQAYLGLVVVSNEASLAYVGLLNDLKAAF